MYQCIMNRIYTSITLVHFDNNMSASDSTGKFDQSTVLQIKKINADSKVRLDKHLASRVEILLFKHNYL